MQISIILARVSKLGRIGIQWTIKLEPSNVFKGLIKA